jgi:hypothetical protein
MQTAAGMGTDALLNLLQKQGPPRGDFVYNPNPEPDPVNPFPFDMYQNSPPSRSRESATAHLRPIRLLDAVSEKLAKIPLMRRLAERMGKEKPEVGGSQILDAVGRNPTLRNLLAETVVEVAKDPDRFREGSGNVWEEEESINQNRERLVQIIITQDEENRTFLHQYIEEIEYLEGRRNRFPQRITVYIALNSISNKSGEPVERNQSVIKISTLKNSKDGAVEIESVSEMQPFELNLDFSLLNEWTQYIVQYQNGRAEGNATTWLDHYMYWNDIGLKAAAFGGALPFGPFIISGSASVSAWISGLTVMGVEIGSIISTIVSYWGVAPTSVASFSSWAISLLISIFVKKDKGFVADVGVALGGVIYKVPRTPHNVGSDAMSASTYAKYRKLLIEPLER